MMRGWRLVLQPSTDRWPIMENPTHNRGCVEAMDLPLCQNRTEPGEPCFSLRNLRNLRIETLRIEPQSTQIAQKIAAEAYGECQRRACPAFLCAICDICGSKNSGLIRRARRLRRKSPQRRTENASAELVWLFSAASAASAPSADRTIQD